MKSSGGLAIGELAAKFGLATSVLRHWEQAGVLPRPARASGQRRYAEGDAWRVATVLLCQESGFSLEEARQILRARTSPARRRMLERKRAELDARIARAEAAKRMIDEALSCRATDPVTCPHFRAALEARISAERGRTASPRGVARARSPRCGAGDSH